MANVFARKPNLGFSLIEVVLSLAVFGLSVGLIELIITSVRADATVLNRIKARSLVLDQIEVLRHLDFSTISNSDTNSFIGDVWNLGQWKVETIGSTQALSASGSGEQVLLVPGDRWATVTLSGQLYVSSASAPGYNVGVLLRAQQANIRYRLRLSSSGAFIERELSGVVTILATINTPTPTNTWQNFSFGINGSTITATVGANTVSVTDATPIPVNGHAALWSQAGCCVSFDNLNITSTKGAATWNFEGSSNPVGLLPAEWKRLSLSSLPGGTAHVVIQDQSGVELKKATVIVTWSDRNQTRNESLTTYITRYGLQVE